ncbi:MAG: hypothetical protein OHK0029_18660 [Armatimonadaceae bacterium]
MEILPNKIHNANRRAARPAVGFTLIELLVVIALTGLLLALLLGPLIQAFGLTNRARALAEAQDAARTGIERLKRELAQAAYVYDNTNTPIILPLDLPSGNEIRDPAFYPPGPGGITNPRPAVAYAKIDFVPVATEGEGPGTVIDPTTDKPLGGSRVTVPGAPGRRVVRYFVGLRNNEPINAQPAFYQNVYEFPRTDREMNPFVLYRAEFNPNDPNLIRPGAAAFDSGGFHDPNFFYNYDSAANGATYAANWRAVSDPILSTTNLDVIAWRRGSDGQIVNGNPIQLLVNFSPSTVVGDTATPGFLSNVQAEAPGAVPSLYTARYGQWVLPFTLTVYRGATEYGGDAQAIGVGEPFGVAQFIVENALQPNGTAQLQVRMPDAGRGRLETTNYYWLQDAVSNKIHVFTDNLAFTIDPSRGRIEAAFPPLATQAGVPLFVPAGARAAAQMAAGPVGNFGQLVPLLYQQTTRDDNPNDEQFYGEPSRAAGLNYQDPQTGDTFFVPINQGVVRAELFDRPGGDFQGFRYFDGGGTGYASPFNVFGNATNGVPFRGIHLIAGSETVMGPDNNLSLDPNNPTNLLMVTYYRVPSAMGTISKKASVIGEGANSAYVWNAQMNYRLESDLGNFNAPFLQFDQPSNEANGRRDSAAGLPAVPQQSTAPQGLLRVTYLWQNNYAKNAAGQPINAQGQPTTNNLQGNDANRSRPEADVIKLDYATRSVMNISVGARVYDTNTRTPQAAEVTDKVQIRNVSR